MNIKLLIFDFMSIDDYFCDFSEVLPICRVANIFLYCICFQINLLICNRIEAWMEEIFHHLWPYQEVAVVQNI